MQNIKKLQNLESMDNLMEVLKITFEAGYRYSTTLKEEDDLRHFLASNKKQILNFLFTYLDEATDYINNPNI